MEKATSVDAGGGGKDIRIADVNVFYGKFQALKNINLEIKPGEFFAFLGPSGCGKTTLLRLIAGFVAARSGSIRIGGSEILALPPWQRDVGLVFQSYALWPHMSVWKNVAFGLEERRRPAAEIAERVKAALELVGLSHLAERRPSQLSGGQQQRVALARTIAIEPKILLLDEPLSNLDAKMRVQVRRELRELQQRLGITTIFVTHDQEEANTICDRIAVFRDGEIQQVGTPMELYERPANLFVANFLGTANVLSGRIAGNDGMRKFAISEELEMDMPASVASGEGTKVIFRPQHAALRQARGDEIALPGHIVNREFLGSAVRYGVRVGNNEVLIELPFRSGGELMSVGKSVDLAVSTHSLLWLKD